MLATLPTTHFEDCYCTDGHQEDNYLNQLAKECSRQRVKHPLAKGLVKFEIKAYYNHYQA